MKVRRSYGNGKYHGDAHYRPDGGNPHWKWTTLEVVETRPRSQTSNAPEAENGQIVFFNFHHSPLLTDVAALLNTIGWNIEQPAAPRFQRKVSFDHLTQAGVERLQAFAAESGMQLLKTLDAELVQHSTDEGGEFAGLGIYVFSESGQAGRAR